jgi:hypothetical protein
MNKPAKGSGVDKATTLLEQHQDAGAREDGPQAGRAIPDVPLAQARNHTPFAAQYFQTVDQHGEVFHVVALKVTYAMDATNADGSLAYAEEQASLASADVWSGEVGGSCPLWESDYAPYKPKCDVLVVNAVSRPPPSAWRQIVGQHLNLSPQQRSATRWNCGVALHWMDDAGQDRQWSKQLTVTGPRSWGLVGLGGPEHTSEVAITWENAFGGTHRDPPEDILNKDGSVKAEAGAWLDQCDGRNPVGKGVNKGRGQPGPQLETSALNPYHGGVTQGRYPPVSLTPLARHWEPRLSLAGTYDKAWLEDQWPLPPLDFDYGYWNCAPEDQQIAYPSPGLQILLVNLFGSGDPATEQDGWTGRLPEHELFLLWRLHNGTMPTKPLQLDTLVVDLKTRQIKATYRGLMSAAAGVRVVECRMEQEPRQVAAQLQRFGDFHGR